MASVFGTATITCKKVSGNRVKYIGVQDGVLSEEEIFSTPINSEWNNKPIPFRIYWEDFYKEGELYIMEL